LNPVFPLAVAVTPVPTKLTAVKVVPIPTPSSLIPIPVRDVLMRV
jgi:hypothetical protein